MPRVLGVMTDVQGVYFLGLLACVDLGHFARLGEGDTATVKVIAP